MAERSLPPCAQRAFIEARLSHSPFAGCVGVAAHWHRARSPLLVLGERLDELDALRWRVRDDGRALVGVDEVGIELRMARGVDDLRACLQQPLDPVGGPVARAVWSPDLHRLAVIASASIVDRWSVATLVDAIVHGGRLGSSSGATNPALRPTDDEPPPPRWELPEIDRARAMPYAGRHRRIPLDVPLAAWARAVGVTVDDLLAAALQVVLARYGAARWGLRRPRRSGAPYDLGPDDDPVVITTTDEGLAGKTLDDLARSWAACRQATRDDPSFAERARGIDEPTCAPLAQVGIDALPAGAGRWLAEDVLVPHELDLSLSAVDDAVVLGVREGVLPPVRVDALARHLRATIEHQGIAVEAPWVDPRGARECWGPSMRWDDVPPTITEALCAEAQRAPTAVALIDGSTGRRISRGDLLAQGSQWSAALVAQGVCPGDRVALALPRSVDRYVGLVAALLAGAVYVPVDPALPADRIATVLDDAGARVVLTTRTTSIALPKGSIRIDLDGPVSADPPVEPLRPAPGDPLYILYTSGSTGRPKGVINTHEGVRNSLLWMRDWFGLHRDQILIHKTSISFDVSGWELLLPLVTAVSVVIAGPGQEHDPRALAATMSRHRVTWATFVPSTLGPFLDLLDRPLPSLQHLALIGEALPRDLVERSAAMLPHVRVANLYGPTEAAIQVSVWDCVASEPDVPIGHPIANTRLVVRDRWGQPAPVGAVGELEIAGVQVARGYHGRPDLNARSFRSRSDGMRSYASGDLVWCREDGALMFVGRRDGQVKIRGQRIELGEVEAALRALPGIREAAAVVRDGQLVAYVVGEVDQGAACRALAGRLSSGAVPSRIVTLESLPLTASGKLDRKALPVPVAPSVEAASLPDDPRLREVLAVLADVLGLASPEAVPVDGDFFDLGGDSLRALAVDARLARSGFALGSRRPTVLHHRNARAILGALGSSCVEYDPLVVPLVRSGRGAEHGAALFMIHAAGGRAIAYTPLARRLQSLRPSLDVYGIRASGLYPGEPVLRRVTAMARRYRDAIRSVQPRGPIRLAGWSFGGIVALEIARLLALDGEPPAFVGLLDSWLPIAPDGGRPRQQIDEGYLWGVCNRVYGGLVGREELLDSAKLRALPDDAARLAAVLAQVRTLGVFPEGADVERAMAVLEGTLHATYDHDHSLVYEGPVVGFRSKERHINAPNPALVWVERALLLPEDSTEIDWVDGSHYSCVLEPHVASLAQALATRHELDPLALRNAS
ncbi:MAG: amino acid adenylation domain-containing protein [Myxococcota bacterium]